MRKLSDIGRVSSAYDHPAGASDTVYRLTRRNGRTYDVSINEIFGTIGVCEVATDTYGNECFIDVYFAQGEDAQNDLTTYDGSFKSPKAIIAYLDSAGALDA